MLVSSILFSYAAQTFGMDAQIRGKMLDGKRLNEKGVSLHQSLITFFCCKRQHVHLFSQASNILRFSDQPANLFSIMTGTVKLMQKFMWNSYNFGS